MDLPNDPEAGNGDSFVKPGSILAVEKELSHIIAQIGREKASSGFFSPAPFLETSGMHLPQMNDEIAPRF